MRNALPWIVAVLAALTLAGCGDEASTTSDEPPVEQSPTDADAEAEAQAEEDTQAESDAASDESASDDTGSSPSDPKVTDYNEVISPYLSQLIDDPASADSASASADLSALAENESDKECSDAAEATADEITDESGTPEERRARINDASATLQLC